MDSITNKCPAYRVRIFLSVDLAGSTAFKVGAGKNGRDERTSQPLWVQITRNFYTKFPEIFETCFAARRLAVSRSEQDFVCPTPWKTIGDEIIFYSKIIDLKHLSCCVDAFLEALNKFGLLLDDIDGRPLDVKGAGWVAAFPCPNVTVALDSKRLRADQFDEAFEAAADLSPNGIDFLGNSIDAGFRVAGRSASDRFALSVELAWLLAEAADRGEFGHKFNYHQRQILKGVLKDRPYPIVSIETERNRTRRKVREHERRLDGTPHFQPWELRDFLFHFMADERIEPPAVAAEHGAAVDLPPSYRVFADKWRDEAVTEERRRAGELEGEAEEHGRGDVLPPGILEAADHTIADAHREAASAETD